MKLKFLWCVGFKDNVAKNVKNGWEIGDLMRGKFKVCEARNVTDLGKLTKIAAHLHFCQFFYFDIDFEWAKGSNSGL